jgi:hypothetical protein
MPLDFSPSLSSIILCAFHSVRIHEGAARDHAVSGPLMNAHGARCVSYKQLTLLDIMAENVYRNVQR